MSEEMTLEEVKRGLVLWGRVCNDESFDDAEWGRWIGEHGGALLALARRALELEEREAGIWGRVNALAEKVLEQPAPTGEVLQRHLDEARAAASGTLCGAEWIAGYARGMALGEQAAYQRGRQEAQGGWVAVGERLPEDGVLVLLWHCDWPPSAPPGYGRYTRDDDDGSWWEDVSQQDQSGESTLYYSGVTHWRPLPPPPSDTGKGGE